MREPGRASEGNMPTRPRPPRTGSKNKEGGSGGYRYPGPSPGPGNRRIGGGGRVPRPWAVLSPHWSSLSRVRSRSGMSAIAFAGFLAVSAGAGAFSPFSRVKCRSAASSPRDSSRVSWSFALSGDFAGVSSKLIREERSIISSSAAVSWGLASYSRSSRGLSFSLMFRVSPESKPGNSHSHECVFLLASQGQHRLFFLFLRRHKV